ncbi:MAG: acyl-CoA reductase, partial [Salegentibacter mishustinae]|nr:acyl-CoA reductase [Salegentibacter mishustinae]
MTIEERKSYFVELGKFLSLFEDKTNNSVKIAPHYERFFNELNDKIDQSIHYNGWFTRENVIFSLQQWSKALTPSNLDTWLKPYEFNNDEQKTIAIVMAGNIPLVGFHDFLSVLISGHKVLVKQSSNDKQLLPVIAAFLMEI